jgi:Uma2 family endonuclease
VREYWVFDPFARSIWVYRLGQDGHFDQGELRETPVDLEPIASKVLEGFSIDPAAIFDRLA